jgi:hypothetical protein
MTQPQKMREQRARNDGSEKVSLLMALPAFLCCVRAV